MRLRLPASGQVTDGADPVPDPRMLLRIQQPVRHKGTTSVIGVHLNIGSSVAKGIALRRLPLLPVYGYHKGSSS